MSDGATPRFSVCELALPKTTFEYDLELCRTLGIEWLGIDERKVAGQDPAFIRRRLDDSGIGAGICSPSTLSILPSDIIQGSRHDPEDRVKDIIAGMRFLAQIDPVSVFVVTGPAGQYSEAMARDIVVDGLAAISAEANRLGVTLGIETMRPEHGPFWSIITGIPQALDLIEEVGSDIKIVYDVWHVWKDDDIIALTERHADRIVGVQLSDYRDPTRVPMDRVLPGDGVIDLAGMFGALERGGFDGIYDLEVFSDPTLPDSVWNRPPMEWVADGRRGFLEAWARRN
jgi:sugar phosphate isomerase/epimerase